jgi:hypothetical protein
MENKKEKISKYWEDNPEGELENELSIIEKASGCERGEIKQIIRPIIKKLLSLQKQEIVEKIEKMKNPYPSEIFTPISKSDLLKINKLLIKELGFPIDRLSGNLGRTIWDVCITQLNQTLNK